MEKKSKVFFFISFVGFIILFIYFNSEKKGLDDFFKSDEELFLDDFAPIEMKQDKYLGEVADTTNHMYPYMNFGKICLPMLDQWKDKIKPGDYVSKKRDSLTLLIERRGENYYLYFEKKNFDSAPSPCDCKKIGVRN